MIIVILAMVLITGCISSQLPAKNVSDTQNPTPVQSVQQTIEPENITQSVESDNIKVENVIPSKKSIDIIVFENLMKIAPLFSDYYDDITINDYQKLASDNLALKKEILSQQDYFGVSQTSTKIEDARSFSSNDKVLFLKYVKYLDIMNKLVSSTNQALKSINDDNSKLTSEEKTLLIREADFNRNDGYNQINAIFDSCEAYENKCGKDDSIIIILKEKPLAS